MEHFAVGNVDRMCLLFSHALRSFFIARSLFNILHFCVLMNSGKKGNSIDFRVIYKILLITFKSTFNMAQFHRAERVENSGSFQNHPPTHLEIVTTWCYRKPFYILKSYLSTKCSNTILIIRISLTTKLPCHVYNL